MTAAVATRPDDAPVQHDLVQRALGGKFIVAPHEVNEATKQHLRRLAAEKQVVFANGGWTRP